jgi:type I restriction enzyme S subunit
LSQFDELPEIPMTWEWAKLPEIGELNRGKSKHRPRNDPALYGGHYPFIQTGDVRSASGVITKFIQTYSELGLKQSRLWPKGTLCITIAANIAETAILGFDSCFPDSVVGFLPDETSCDVRFVEYFLRTAKHDISQFAPATAQKNINLEILRTVAIPLPPLNEQRRIVEKIEALTARSRKAREALEAIPELLDQFRQSVLATAFRGDLTADWREQNPDVEPAEALLERIAKARKEKYLELCKSAKEKGERKPRKVFQDVIPIIDNRLQVDLPATWTISNIDFLAHVTKLAGFEYTKYIKLQDSGEIPVVRAQNVQMGRFVESDIKYISKEISDSLERSQLHGREVLMVFIGAGTGNVCLAPQEGRWHLAPNVAKIDPDKINPKFLLYYLQSPLGRKNTQIWEKATAQQSLSMGTIRKIAVYLPPLEEQTEIVNRLENLIKAIDQKGNEYLTLFSNLDQLDQSILAKAFRGELVSQDPNDEPAAVLLERIRAEREKVGGKKGSKRSR